MEGASVKTSSALIAVIVVVPLLIWMFRREHSGERPAQAVAPAHTVLPAAEAADSSVVAAFAPPPTRLLSEPLTLSDVTLSSFPPACTELLKDLAGVSATAADLADAFSLLQPDYDLCKGTNADADAIFLTARETCAAKDGTACLAATALFQMKVIDELTREIPAEDISDPGVLVSRLMIGLTVPERARSRETLAVAERLLVLEPDHYPARKVRLIAVATGSDQAAMRAAVEEGFLFLDVHGDEEKLDPELPDLIATLARKTRDESYFEETLARLSDESVPAARLQFHRALFANELGNRSRTIAALEQLVAMAPSAEHRDWLAKARTSRDQKKLPWLKVRLSASFEYFRSNE